MECTKGKLKWQRVGNRCELFTDDAWIGELYVGYGMNKIEEMEANAKELVRRWNAFEKDGLVDELRAALKDLMAAPETLPPDNEFDKEQRDYRNRCMTRIDEARKLAKTVIAQAEKQV